MLKGIPPHEQVITHYRIPVHIGCWNCGEDLIDSPTEFVQYAGIAFNWPEAWCLSCGLPQYVDLGEPTKHLRPMPLRDSEASLRRLKRLLSKGAIPPGRVVRHDRLPVHAPCVECDHDLIGSRGETIEYAGRFAYWPEAWCEKCGFPQYVDMGQATAHLVGGKPRFDRAAFLDRLKRTMTPESLPPEHIRRHDRLLFHASCEACGYDLFGLPTEYVQYIGIVLDPPEVLCPECGKVQHVRRAGDHWINTRIAKAVLSGSRST
jgi:hypothetical protein